MSNEELVDVIFNKMSKQDIADIIVKTLGDSEQRAVYQDNIIKNLRQSLVEKDEKIKSLIEENKKLVEHQVVSSNESVWIWWGYTYYVLVPDGADIDGFEKYKIFSANKKDWIKTPYFSSRGQTTQFNRKSQRAVFEGFRNGVYELNKLYQMDASFASRINLRLKGIELDEIKVMYRKGIEIDASIVISETIKTQQELLYNRGDLNGQKKEP